MYATIRNYSGGRALADALAGGTIGRFLRRRKKRVRIASGGIYVGLGADAASS